MTSNREWKVGDRVRVLVSKASGWTYHYQRLIATGQPATVRHVGQECVNIEFDRSRGQNHTLYIAPKYLEAAQSNQTQEQETGRDAT